MMTPDASSRFQDSLPVSSDTLLEKLTEWGIAFQRHDHVPLKTVADSKLVQDMFLSAEEGGGNIKNLYLRDHKKRNFLIVTEQDCKFDLKALPHLIGSGRLSFGSSDRLMENLGVRPGAVTPLAMINGVSTGVRMFMDASLQDCKMIYPHPLVNDRTLAMTPDGLVAFLSKIECKFDWITIQ
ncbi:MAG: prolyl-tRNA synthetase associated domain-containing protein [Paracoccaceae bacterium]